MSLTLPSPPSSSLPEADFFFLSFRRFLRRKPKVKIAYKLFIIGGYLKEFTLETSVHSEDLVLQYFLGI